MPLTRRVFHRSLLSGGAALAGGSAMAGVAALAADSVPAQEPATEGGDKWYRLFDGRTLAGWTPKIAGEDLGDDRNQTFQVSEGVLQVRYHKYGDFRERFGHLFFKEPISRYRLRLEYRFVGEQCKGGHSGLFRDGGVAYHCADPELMAKDQQFPVALELQLLGGDGTSGRSTGNLCTPGTHVVYNEKLYQDHIIGSTSKTFHGDQWVAAEIEVHGAEKILHRINGETVLRYEQPQYDPDSMDARRLIPGDLLMIEGGSIALQSKSHPVDYRNIDLVPLG
ncbi:MAG: 3-keto-disaccharide hydrolase [Planctomycetia bacterium]